MKVIWELNRHQFLPTLDRELARRLVRDWIAQNPCEFGINWNSAMEVGLTVIAWIETFGRDEFAGALAQHARFVQHNLSSDWIARSNHLIGEAAALAVYEGRPNKWLRQAVVEQFYPSGVDREQSVSYHHFVTHLLTLAGMPQPKSMAYLAAIRQPDGSLPHVGDGDDGKASTKPLENLPAPATSAAFPDAGHYIIRHANNYCFVRCGMTLVWRRTTAMGTLTCSVPSFGYEVNRSLLMPALSHTMAIHSRAATFAQPTPTMS